MVERVRHTYACGVCSRTADPADHPVPTIATAALPPQPIDKGLPGPGLLAHVVVSKFADHQPLYRQSGILGRHGVDVPRSTLGGWVAAAADLLKPLADRMAELVRQSQVTQTDDTPAPVLDPGSRRTKTGHLWVYLGDAEHPYAVFDFTPTYSGDGPKAWLGGYAGYAQADALKQYDPLFDRPPPRPIEVGCWAHARRKFHDARTTDPAQAHEALARIRRLYDVEAEIKPLDDTGGRSPAVLYSVVGTSRRVGVEPFGYLRGPSRSWARTRSTGSMTCFPPARNERPREFEGPVCGFVRRAGPHVPDWHTTPPNATRTTLLTSSQTPHPSSDPCNHCR